MKKSTQTRINMLCVWSGLVFAALVLIGGVLVSGFLPPPSPSLSADQVAEIYRSRPNMIRIGMVLMMMACAFAIPLTSVITHFISKIEGRIGTISVMQIMGGYSNMILFFYPCMWWLTAGYRPERDPQLISLMHDAGWLQFQGALWPFLLMMGSIAIATFVDDSDKPVFPRWVGYFNVFEILTYLPDQLIFFFKQGPFAWNGIFPWWIPAVSFFGWVLVMFFVLRKAVINEANNV